MFVSIKRHCVSGWLVRVLAVVLFGLSSFAVALPVMDITTPDTALTIPVGGTADAVYTVTNTSGIVLPGLSIHAPALMQVNPAATTCGTSLGIGGVCEVGVTIGPSGLAGLLLLKPLGVCAFGGQLCAAATRDQRIQANFTSSNSPLPPGDYIYLTLVIDDVEIFDRATEAVVATIAGGGDRGIEITSDGTRAYVSSRSNGTVNVIDTATNIIVETIAVGSTPSDLEITPDGSSVYVVTNTGERVYAIDTATNTFSTIPMGENALNGLAITPDGLRVYVGNSGTDDVRVIDTMTNTVVGSPIAIDSPIALAVTPDGLRIYVVNGSPDTVGVIDTMTDTVIGSPIAVGDNPVDIDITPDGLRAYVANQASNNVSVINTTTDTVIGSPIAVGDSPVGIAISPDGSRAYVINRDSNNISVIDTATDTVISTAAVGATPSGYADFLSVPSP